MNVQFKKGALELCVLVLICKKEQYGYELAQNVAKYISIAEGTLYPLLRRLTKEQYLDTYMSPSREGPARKYYKLSEKGEERMETLIEEWNQFTVSVNGLVQDIGRGEA
ncbi:MULTISPECIES: PadR family transcriptional regulator [Sediminibacillus]|uniref:PadR family transcriptional regulator n=1 Tax=Sediminibacillus TaxID=482460 RepID=UPI00040BE9E7|nr:PadR family transcriptional regulator [Sediminibacillus terrae]